MLFFVQMETNENKTSINSFSVCLYATVLEPGTEALRWRGEPCVTADRCSLCVNPGQGGGGGCPPRCADERGPVWAAAAPRRLDPLPLPLHPLEVR